MPRQRKMHDGAITTTNATTKKISASRKKIKSGDEESFSERKMEETIEERLLENMIKLQKIHTDLAEKFDKLAKEISSLLALFELAAKSFSKHSEVKISDADKSFLEKIDKLLEQNKTIAKGLTIMEEQIRKKMYGSYSGQQMEERMGPVESGFVSQQVPVRRQEKEQTEFIQSMKTNRPLPKF